MVTEEIIILHWSTFKIYSWRKNGYAK